MIDRAHLLSFSVPGQPQSKGRPRVGKVGAHARLFTPAKTVAYEGLVALAARQAMDAQTLVEGPVAVVMTIMCQVPESWSKKKRGLAFTHQLRPTTKPDVDNVVKAVFDGLNGVVWRDDVQVVDLSLSKRYGPMPGVDVSIFSVALGEQAR